MDMVALATVTLRCSPEQREALIALGIPQGELARRLAEACQEAVSREVERMTAGDGTAGSDASR